MVMPKVNEVIFFPPPRYIASASLKFFTTLKSTPIAEKCFSPHSTFGKFTLHFESEGPKTIKCWIYGVTS